MNDDIADFFKDLANKISSLNKNKNEYMSEIRALENGIESRLSDIRPIDEQIITDYINKGVDGFILKSRTNELVDGSWYLGYVGGCDVWFVYLLNNEFYTVRVTHPPHTGGVLTWGFVELPRYNFHNFYKCEKNPYLWPIRDGVLPTLSGPEVTFLLLDNGIVN